MEVFISNIDERATLPELKKAIASVLHGPDFTDYHTLPLNFEIRFIPARRAGPVCATLVIPSWEVAEQFLEEYGEPWPRQYISVGPSNEDLKFKEGKYDPRPETIRRILQTPYVDPTHEEEQLKLARELREHLVRVDVVQFGWECRDDVFSVEYEKHCLDAGRLGFDGDRRQFRLKIHEPERNVIIVLRPTQIAKAAIARDSESRHLIVSFSLNYAPAYEDEDPTDVYLDDDFDLFDLSKPRNGSGPPRARLSNLGDDHEIYAEFTSLSLRFVCQDSYAEHDFLWICQQAHVQVARGVLPTVRREIFSPATVAIYDNWVQTLPWPVAFQVDALARANILDLQEIMQLRTLLAGLLQQRGAPWTAAFIQYFGQEVSTTSWYQQGSGSVHVDPLEVLFARCRRTFLAPPDEDTQEETFMCYHAKVTPSRILLEGPFPERCNRVMRRYAGYTCNFLRVTFMDENRVQYRFDRDVDGYEFIKGRFGSLLFEGLWLAGRHFHFLAYSQSALKNHSVWFVRNFKMDDNGFEVEVTPDSIIQGLGDFQGISHDLQLMHCPARYGARIAQAFTTTEAAVEVEVEEVIFIPDIMDAEERRSFTDGIGTVSQELADEIWAALQGKSVRHRRYGRCKPKAFQIRFQGSKGMLSVDYTLSGRAVCLRPSMEKFKARHSMTIEIASVFNKPGRFYLNRPLIMLLEGLKVRGGYDIFKTLQDAVIQDTKDATKSYSQAATLCEGYGLGTAFKISSIFNDFTKLGGKSIEDAFLLQCLNFGVYHILRDLKYHARIPVPNGYTLVGVADIHGYLEEGQIFVCVAQSDDDEPTYLEGEVMITRSPVIDPGDVQLVHAIGRPPRGTPFDHEPLTNTIVFSTKGRRPLASCLSGGDLDGDVFMVTALDGLLPTEVYEPAEYASAERKTVPHISTRADIAEFIIEYFYSDNIGMIASSWLIQADQSEKGIHDEACLTLAELHSDAADYPKTGNPVPMKKVPRYALPNMKPDWNAPEITDATLGLFYQSQRYIGRLYREVKISVPQTQPPPVSSADVHLSPAEVLVALRTAFKPRKSNIIERVMYARASQFISMPDALQVSDTTAAEMCSIFQDYVRTLRQICVSFNIAHKRGARRLSEEEVVAGTIVAQSTQPKVRKEAMSQMREQSSILVNRIAARIVGPKEEDGGKKGALTRAWLAYRLSTLRPHDHAFGFRSFGLVAMHEIFDAIKWIVAAEEREKLGVMTV